MRTFVVMLMILLLSAPGHGQQAVPPAQSVLPAYDQTTLFGIPVDQALTTGFGILAGAIALHAFIGGGASLMAGGLVGALIGNWWFEQDVWTAGYDYRPQSASWSYGPLPQGPSR
jgi:hypothetical protein